MIHEEVTSEAVVVRSRLDIARSTAEVGRAHDEPGVWHDWWNTTDGDACYEWRSRPASASERRTS
jgi:hypothetical protein